MLDAVNREIIRLLQQDGRASNVEIARQLGVSEATVRKRLERLVAEGTIRIAAVPDPGSAGFGTIAFMTLSVDLAMVSQIGDRIAALPQVRSVYCATGENELIVEAWFTSGDDLLRFMTEDIGCIPGIRRMTTAQVLRTIKDPSRWILPQAFALPQTGEHQ
jgi:Lrp/AsnC family transcriptional regulator for asnA, asnC and gidA